MRSLIAKLAGRSRHPAAVPGAGFDLASPELQLDPIPHFRALRAAGPVAFLPANGCYLVLGHDEVKSALARPHIFSSRCLAAVDPVLLGADPPLHTEARRRLARFFSPAELKPLTASIDDRIAALLRPKFDVVGEFAVPLTRSTTGSLVGLPEEDVAFVLEILRGSRGAAHDGSSPELPAVLRRALLYRRLTEEAGGLAECAALSLVALLCAAASETAERLIVQCVLALLRSEEVRRSVAAAPALVAPFVEEVARLYPSEPVAVREAVAPVELGGIAIPEGARVFLSLLAANRDPAHFDDPDALRPDGSRKPHLTFGGGPHHCIGAGLGRRLVCAALSALLAEGRSLRPAEPLGEIQFRPVQGLPFPERLTVSI